MITSPAYTDQLYNIIRGVQYELTMTMYMNNALMDLSTYTATFGIKESADSDQIITTLSSSDGLTMGGTAGTIGITIPATKTAILPAGTVYFYLDMVRDGINQRFAEGPIKVRR